MTLYFISRHPGARAWARRQGIRAVFLDHLANPAQIRPGDEVLGMLPIRLAAAIRERGAKYFHLDLDLPPSHRGEELSPEQMADDGATLTSYDVHAGPSWDPNPRISRYDQRSGAMMPPERNKNVTTHLHFRRRIRFSILFGCAASLFALAGAAAYEGLKPLVATIGEWFSSAPHGAVHDPWIPVGPVNLALALLISIVGLIPTYRAYTEFRVRFRYDITRHSLQPAAADILILPVSYPDRGAAGVALSRELPRFMREDHLHNVVSVLRGEPSIRWGHGHTAGPAGTRPALTDVVAPDFWAVSQASDHWFHAFAWQTGFQTVRRFLGGANEATHLRFIHLIPSAGTKDFAEKYYSEMLRALLAPRDDTRFQPEPTIIVHDPVEYTDFRDVQSTLNKIVEDGVDIIRNKNQYHPEANRRHWWVRCPLAIVRKLMLGDAPTAPVVVIDVTGGTASFSAVAALQAAGTEGILYSHVVSADAQNPTAGMEVRIYGVDAVAFKGDV